LLDVLGPQHFALLTTPPSPPYPAPLAGALAVLDASTHHILEIGCHLGKSTEVMQQRVTEVKGTGRVIGVDIGPAIIAKAQKRSPSIQYECMSAWETEDLLSLGVPFDVILVDVGGLSGHDCVLDSVALLMQLCYAFKSSVKFVIIKSKCMRDLSKTFVGWHSTWGGGEGSGGAEGGRGE
jgi:hypothetical protein